MNFLAHFHLAWPDEGLIAGGLEGDFFKGPLRGQRPAGIELGIKLHRSIDVFTDNHPEVVALRREFPNPYRRYAGILIDLSFDHYLSLYWTQFSELELAQFNKSVYRCLQQQRQYLGSDANKMAQRMQQHDILSLYTDWETVPASATRIGERFSRGNPFIDIDEVLSPQRERLEQAFLHFYPDLQSFTRQQLETREYRSL